MPRLAVLLCAALLAASATVQRVEAASSATTATAMTATTATATPTVKVAYERLVSIAPTSLAGRAWEPIAATHPTDPARIAVIYQHRSGSIAPVLRISHDAGLTWRSATGRPGGYSGTDQHAALAWGPGPAGRARLYYVNMNVVAGAHRASTSYSDNEGRTWSKLYVERRTPSWMGGFPEITVDRNPASPNYGVVYLAYNWLASASKGPGLRVLASADFGRTWNPLEVPVARVPSGYGDTWRIAYRLRTSPDGAAYVSFWQADLRFWDVHNVFRKGGTANTGRIGFSVARFVFDRNAGTFISRRTVMAARLPETAWNMGAAAAGTSGGVYTDPAWSVGLDVDQTTGRVYLAVGADAAIRVYRSDDLGQTWTFKTIPAASRINGRSQAVWKPNLVVGRGYLMVTLHTLDRVSAGATVGNAYSISYDEGATWSRPIAINSTRWRAANLARVSNGPGLRERADLTADGNVFFTYGDGRLAAGARAGHGAVYGTLIRVAGIVPD
jgi:hypothetical protein